MHFDFFFFKKKSHCFGPKTKLFFVYLCRYNIYYIYSFFGSLIIRFGRELCFHINIIVIFDRETRENKKINFFR